MIRRRQPLRRSSKPITRRPMVARTRRPLGTVRREAMAAGDLTSEQWAAICDFYRDSRGGVWCAYCERRPATQRDHVYPIARGGRHTAANVVPTCLADNLRKGTSTRWQPVRRHPFMEPAA